MTTDQMLIAATAGLGALFVLLLGYLFGSRSRRRALTGNAGAVALPPGAEALAPAFNDLRADLSTMRTQIEDMRRSSAAADERRKQEDQAWDRLTRVETTLPTIQQSLQTQIAEALRNLGDIKAVQAAEQARWTTEDNAFTALQHLTSVMLGSVHSGAVAERVVEANLAALPPQWRISNHTVHGKTVEFAIRLPDGLILSIDSKFVAQSELKALTDAKDGRQIEHLKREIQKKVLEKAAEVQKYVDTRSVSFAIAAVSDAVYAVSGPVLPTAYQKYRALIVPNSLLAPFVLMIYEQHQHSDGMDAARLARMLMETQRHLNEASNILNTHLSGALTTLTNARDKLGRELAAAALSLEESRSAGEIPDGQPQSKSA